MGSMFSRRAGAVGFPLGTRVKRTIGRGVTIDRSAVSARWRREAGDSCHDSTLDSDKVARGVFIGTVSVKVAGDALITPFRLDAPLAAT